MGHYPPLDLVGDSGGGALYLALGLACALLEAKGSGVGHVVDAAMIDGAAGQMIAECGLRAAGSHYGPRGTNMLDGRAPFYDVYVCVDGHYLSPAPIEHRFRAVLLDAMGFGPDFPAMDDPAHWPAARAGLAAKFLEQRRDGW